MSRSVAIIGALLLALSLWLGWQLREAKREVQDKSGVIAGLKEDLASTTNQLVAVDLMARANDGFQLAYQKERDAIAAAAAERAEQFRRLQNEKPDVKRWADAPLPGDVIRMHRRPAITGAAGYRAYLSENSAVSASGE